MGGLGEVGLARPPCPRYKLSGTNHVNRIAGEMDIAPPTQQVRQAMSPIWEGDSWGTEWEQGSSSLAAISPLWPVEQSTREPHS